MAFQWSYQGPTSTFADTLLVDGKHTSGRVVRYRRPAPAADSSDQPGQLGEPYYVGLCCGDKVPGEHADLADAHRAVETAVKAPPPEE